MRVLLSEDDRAPVGSEVDDAALERIYAFPERPWVRANFVSTLDGSATGSDDRSGSINTPADNRVFQLQRRLCDAVLVGAGTARLEGYEPVEERAGAPLLVVVSAHARVPAGLQGPAAERPDTGDAVLVTCEAAGSAAIDQACEALGSDAVWVIGDTAVDLAATRELLASKGHRAILTEGGPMLFASLLGAGAVDELALTLSPALVGGHGPRITRGGGIEVACTPVSLLEEDGTLLGLWRVSR